MSSAMFIIGYGDSITAGVYLQEEDTFLHKLGLHFGCKTRNAGIPGQTTAQAWNRLQSSEPVEDGAFCIIQYGMNDHVAVAANTPRVTLNEFARNLERFCNRIREGGGKPILCTIHPILAGDASSYYYARHPEGWYGRPAGAQAWIDLYSQEIREVSRRMGVPLADIAQAWAEYGEGGGNPNDLIRTMENSGMDDGVHPTAQGHDVYADRLTKQLSLLKGAEG